MDLHKEFVKLSFDIIKMKNKLISLLLEIYEKEIYKEKGCRTIYEYAFKYAKLSKEVVDKAIRTLKHLEGKPCLKKIIETQGIHKVALVATIATAANEVIFAKHVENMSKAALFEFAKELRSQQEGMEGVAGRNESSECCFCQAIPSKMQIELDAEMQIMFLKFKEKYAKNFSNQEALRVMMKKMERLEVESESVKSLDIVEAKIRQDDKNIGEKKTGAKMACDEIAQLENLVPGNGKADEKLPLPSRHIPKIKKEEILKKYQHKCAYPGCVKPGETMHHRIPFAFERSHESIIPLCEVHHEFSHNGLISHELQEPENWRLKMAGATSIFDGFYLAKRNMSVEIE